MSTYETVIFSPKEDQELHIYLGYDPALHRPYLVIERSIYEDEEEDLYLYTNLKDDDCEYTLEYFKGILLKHDLLTPAVEKNLEIMKG